MPLRMMIGGSRRPINEARACRRCGIIITPNKETVVTCRDCYDIARAESAAANKGIDLASLADDEWFSRQSNKIRKVDDRGQLTAA